MAQDGAMPQDLDSSAFGEGVRRREKLRKIFKAQSEIFLDLVLYSPPDAVLTFPRLFEEHNGQIEIAAAEFRRWLACNPDGHVHKP